MNFTIIKFLFIAFVLQLCSCTKEKKVKVVPVIDKIAKTKEQSNQKERDSIVISEEDDFISVASRFDLTNPYLAFLYKRHTELFVDNLVLFFEKRDIDLDGRVETIVVFGIRDVNGIFILRKDFGKIREVAYLDNYYTDRSFELISFYGTKRSYMYLKAGNDSAVYGLFFLYGLKNNKIVNLQYIGPKANLVDVDKDGFYDGAINNCSYYVKDTYYYYFEYYDFKKDMFKLANIHLELSNYPSSIYDVLMEYLMLQSSPYNDNNLKCLYLNSPEVSQRLKLLCLDKTARKIKIKYEEYLDDYMEVNFNIKQNNNTATATLINGKKEKLFFQLAKLNEKWHIIKISKGITNRNFIYKDFKALDVPSNYPEKIEDVLLNYISLRSLDNNNLTLEEAEKEKEQLAELCIDKNASKINWNKSIWETAYTLRYFRSSAIRFFKKEDKNNASVITTYIDNKTKIKYQLKFQLRKSDDKWQITKIKVVD